MKRIALLFLTLLLASQLVGANETPKPTTHVPTTHAPTPAPTIHTPVPTTHTPVPTTRAPVPTTHAPTPPPTTARPIRPPRGAPFTGWTSQPQTASGYVWSHVDIPGYPASEAPAILIVNPAQGAYFYNLTAAVGGYQWTLPNGTYYYSQGKCGYIGGYGTQANQVATYTSTVVKTLELDLFFGLFDVDVYSGFPNDVGGGGLGVGTTIAMHYPTGHILQHTFSQWAPSPLYGFSFTVTGTINFTQWEDTAVIPPLIEACWSLDVSLPSSQFWNLFYVPPASYNPAPAPCPPPVIGTSNSSQCATYMSKIVQLYTSIIYPGPIPLLQNPSLLANLFDANVDTRINPLGTFSGFSGTLEYFYGLASFFTTQITSINIKALTCTDNIVSSAVDLLLETVQTTNPNFPKYNLTQVGFFTFNTSSGLITAIDANLLNLGSAENVPLGIDPTTNVTYQQESIGFICTATVYGFGAAGIPQSTVPFNVSVGTCIGQYQIWNNSLGLSEFDYCFAILTGAIPNPATGLPMPFGTFDRANSNTVSCRTIHTLLTPYNPSLHCPHVSPSGGMKCVDQPYSIYYTEGSFIGPVQA